MASNKADAARQAINLRTLQRSDPSIRSVLDSASYVVLYKYINGKWTKEGIEGSLFVFQRSVQPYHGILILNRNGINNYVRQLTTETDLDIQGQIVHVSGGAEPGIFGLWFAGGEPEAENILGLMRRTVDGSTSIPPDGLDQASNSSARVPSANAQPTMLDLLSRLTVAPSTPPSINRSPLLSASNTTSQISTHSPSPLIRNQIPSSSSDPSASLKQLLGLGTPSNPAPPSQPSTPSVQSNLPRSPAPGHDTPKPKLADTGYIPTTDPRSRETSVPGFASDAAGKAILNMLGSNRAQGLDLGSGENSKEGQRDFIRGLLNCIHTNKDFTDDLYRQYLRNKGEGG